MAETRWAFPVRTQADPISPVRSMEAFSATPHPPPPASTSAMPGMHYHAHRVTHAAAHYRKLALLTRSTADQLNQEELARLQSGSSTPPQDPPTWLPSQSGGNSMDMPGPNPGGPGLTPYNR
jgi:hypothetical protein